MAKNKSGYDIYFEDFEYKGIKDELFSYDIPYEKFMDGVRAYFDNQFVTIDVKDNDIWNALVDLNVLDDIFEAMKDWFKEHCREDAYEEYKDYVEWYYDED